MFLIFQGVRYPSATPDALHFHFHTADGKWKGNAESVIFWPEIEALTARGQSQKSRNVRQNLCPLCVERTS
jgi:hypothetical protein